MVSEKTTYDTGRIRGRTISVVVSSICKPNKDDVFGR
jgi:hypothetical protein